MAEMTTIPNGLKGETYNDILQHFSKREKEYKWL